METPFKMRCTSSTPPGDRKPSPQSSSKNAMTSWKNNTSLLENLSKDRRIIKKIPVNKLKKLFDLGYHSKKINIIFNRALKK